MGIGKCVFGDKDELGAAPGILPITQLILWHAVLVERVSGGVEPDRRRAGAFGSAHQPCLLIVHPLLVFGGCESIGHSVPAACEVDHTSNKRWPLASQD